MKPEYKVPSMNEIKKIKHNGFNVVSTFSGAGGSCLGYRMAGFKVLYANEFIPAAQETYKANHPDSYLDTRDIRQVKAKEILEIIGLKKGEVDIFDGSPPCASFSTAGKREEGWGQVKKYSDTKQRVDDLFFEYARLLKELQPKVFIAENVSGLIKGTAKGYFKIIMQELKSCGYRVKASVLNAKWLGVPQNRERLIFIGVRNDLNLDPVFPKPKKYIYSWKDVQKNLRITDPDCWVLPKGKMKILYEYVRDNPEMKGAFVNAHMKLYNKGSMFNHRIVNVNKPVNTVCQGSTSLYHPEEPRSLNISEIKLVSSFPDDFKLTGSFNQKWERIGRAVPPLMMKEIAKTVEREILCKIV